MHKKLKVFLSASILATFVTGIIPLPTSIKTVIPVEAAAINEEKTCSRNCQECMEEEQEATEKDFCTDCAAKIIKYINDTCK